MEFECSGRTFLRKSFDNSTSKPDSTLLKWILILIRDNMEFRHSKSQFLPWKLASKEAELNDLSTKFEVVYFCDKPVAFASYQITTEPDLCDVPIPCLYLYELHVIKEFRSAGLGSYLIKCIHEIASQNSDKCDKIFLTAFQALKNNRLFKSPIAFYLRHGFKPDPISPSQCLKPKEAKFYDYEILSKVVNK